MFADEPHSISSNKNKKKKTKKKAKKQRRCSLGKSDGDVELKSISSNNIGGFGKFPYPTDYNDHFETPARAYEDILPLMECVLVGNRKAEATIYDPYYCAGRAATLLNNVFQQRRLQQSIRIQHEKRDFYRDIQMNTVPQYDILVTNPPYSSNHKERCLDYAIHQLKQYGRPYFLLMPNYVATKEYYRKLVLDNDRIQTYYVVPSSTSPYEYDHPEGTGFEAPPFASIWFCGMAYTTDQTMTVGKSSLIDTFVKYHATFGKKGNTPPRIVSSLQELIHVGGVSGEKRKNPRQRRKMKQQALVGTGGSSVGDTNTSILQQSPKKKRKSGQTDDIEHCRKYESDNTKKRKFT
jgi:hypothetical protein